MKNIKYKKILSRTRTYCCKKVLKKQEKEKAGIKTLILTEQREVENIHKNQS